MKKEDKQLLLYGGGLIIAYFGLIRPILKKVGIVNSANDQLVNNYSNIANAANPFSPIFWKQGGAGTSLIKVAATEALAARIYDAMGYFTDDEAAVYSVFRTLKTQSQVSWLADIFQKKYGSDLFTFLQKGKGILPEAGLNSDEIAVIINLVNKLPKYK